MRALWQRIRRPYYWVMLVQGWLFIPIGVYLYVGAYWYAAHDQLFDALWIGAAGVGYWFGATLLLPLASRELWPTKRV